MQASSGLTTPNCTNAPHLPGKGVKDSSALSVWVSWVCEGKAAPTFYCLHFTEAKANEMPAQLKTQNYKTGGETRLKKQNEQSCSPGAEARYRWWCTEKKKKKKKENQAFYQTAPQRQGGKVTHISRVTDCTHTDTTEAEGCSSLAHDTCLTAVSVNKNSFKAFH